MPKLQTGRWVASMYINDLDTANFELHITKYKNNYTFKVTNGIEVVPFEKPFLRNDTIILTSTYFDTEFQFVRKSNNKIEGIWVNKLRSRQIIPFTATKSEAPLYKYDKKINPANFNGHHWQTVFSTKENSFNAIGSFTQDGNFVEGTFITETGDFRFLTGNVNGNKMTLCGFDASHVYVFKAEKKGDKLIGTFSSGKSYKTDWLAVENTSFELVRGDNATAVKGDPYHYNLTFERLDGSPFQFPSKDYTGKVVILQIMGTWCANCLDETLFYNELYNTYKTQGLEIIGIGYEFNEEKKHLINYQKKLSIEYPLVLGGNSTKKEAHNDFYFLEDVPAFPTSVVVNKEGKIVYVYSGINGPSTGKRYEKFKNDMVTVIESLLKE